MEQTVSSSISSLTPLPTVLPRLKLNNGYMVLLWKSVRTLIIILTISAGVCGMMNTTIIKFKLLKLQDGTSQNCGNSFPIFNNRKQSCSHGSLVSLPLWQSNLNRTLCTTWCSYCLTSIARDCVPPRSPTFPMVNTPEIEFLQRNIRSLHMKIIFKGVKYSAACNLEIIIPCRYITLIQKHPKANASTPKGRYVSRPVFTGKLAFFDAKGIQTYDTYVRTTVAVARSRRIQLLILIQ